MAAMEAAGRGMAPPLTILFSIYGDDDDTLFRLIALGTGQAQSRRCFREARLPTKAPRP